MLSIGIGGEDVVGTMANLFRKGEIRHSLHSVASVKTLERAHKFRAATWVSTARILPVIRRRWRR